jgi:hypothetical protein
MLVGEHGGDPMVPRIAMVQALLNGATSEITSSAPRRKPAKSYRIIR